MLRTKYGIVQALLLGVSCGFLMDLDASIKARIGIIGALILICTLLVDIRALLLYPKKAKKELGVPEDEQ